MTLKKTVFLLLILGWSSLSFTQSITFAYDTLNIKTEDGETIVLLFNDITDLSDSTEWKPLLDEFEESLDAVKDKLPEYEHFKLKYIQGKSLTVDEVDIGNHFTVEDGSIEKASFPNKITLISTYITIRFQMEGYHSFDKEKLASAIRKVAPKVTKIKPRVGFFNMRRFKSKSYDFISKTDRLQTTKRPIRFAATMQMNLGYFKNKPLFELISGIGLSYGVKNRLILLNANNLRLYNEQLGRGERANLISIEHYFHDYAFYDFGIYSETTNSEIALMSGIKYRVGAGVRTKRASVLVHAYLDESFKSKTLGVTLKLISITALTGKNKTTQVIY